MERRGRRSLQSITKTIFDIGVVQTALSIVKNAWEITIPSVFTYHYTLYFILFIKFLDAFRPVSIIGILTLILSVGKII